jgi:hypothetical protein
MRVHANFGGGGPQVKLALGIASVPTWTYPRLAQEVRDSCFELGRIV